MTRKELLLRYILNQSIFLENDFTELQNKNVFRRNCDEIDCLELIIAKARRDLFKEVAKDIMHIYKITSIDVKKAKGE